jgi:Bacterial Ig-like domain
MGGTEYSRREFLRRFAMLSSASLIGLSFGCADTREDAPVYGPVVAYGPPPINLTRPAVTAIYFIDSQSSTILLQNNQNVPVQVICRIDFSKSMNTAVPVTISFDDSAGTVVPVSQLWANDLTLVVTPISQLNINTTYTLSVGNDAEDTFGNKIVLTAAAAATFRTVSA